MSELYHVKLGFPKQAVFIRGTLSLTYSRHALAESINDRYGIIVLPQKLNVENATLIEIEVEMNVVVKSVYRIPLDAERDLVLVVLRDGYVKTVWVNKRNDVHRSLDRSKYRRP